MTREEHASLLLLNLCIVVPQCFCRLVVVPVAPRMGRFANNLLHFGKMTVHAVWRIYCWTFQTRLQLWYFYISGIAHSEWKMTQCLFHDYVAKKLGSSIPNKGVQLRTRIWYQFSCSYITTHEGTSLLLSKAILYFPGCLHMHLLKCSKNLF